MTAAAAVSSAAAALVPAWEIIERPLHQPLMQHGTEAQDLQLLMQLLQARLRLQMLLLRMQPQRAAAGLNLTVPLQQPKLGELTACTGSPLLGD